MTPERERRIRSQAAAKHDREDSRLYYESTQVLLDEIDALRASAREYDELLRQYNKQTLVLAALEKELAEAEQRFTKRENKLFDDLNDVDEKLKASERRVERLREAQQMSIIILRHVINHGLDLDDASRDHITHAAERLEAALSDEPEQAKERIVTLEKELATAKLEMACQDLHLRLYEDDLSQSERRVERLREALLGMMSRYTGLFNGYVRGTYHENSDPDDDLKLSLVDAEAALADGLATKLPVEPSNDSL